MESLIEIRKQPIVLDAEKATLNIIDKGFYTFSSELPSACKVLYEIMILSMSSGFLISVSVMPFDTVSILREPY